MVVGAKFGRGKDILQWEITVGFAWFFCPRGPEKQVQPVSNSKECVKLHVNGSDWM